MGKRELLRRLKGIFHKIVYSFTPMYRLSGGVLEKYEKGVWIPEEQYSNSRFIKQIGEYAYKQYRKGLLTQLSNGQILGIQQMRLWARMVKKSIFTLIGICLTLLGLVRVFPHPLSVITGLVISIISLTCRLLEETELLIPIRRK